MATENFKKAGEIFQNAIEIEDPAERARYLESVCKKNPKLRAEVESLLRAHEKAGDYLEAPAAGANMTQEGPARIEGPGTKIGRYELLELIGEGGMGMVYLAEQQEPVKRRVALKIIKPGMDSKEVIARFEAERQALAMLDHPNIAHVFDAGTTEAGRPYFVMEYVKGMSITRYCDEHRLDVEQRLRLFREVCEGLHYAHQKGIIHRDIKPSNILISMHGDRVVPKIIDFGIAKAASNSLTEKTMFTFQGQLLGTPEYMSPEQVNLATQDIDTRSDIYSLGVVLYELLAGVLPFEKESLHKIGFSELQRTLRELEPASPSIRLSSLGEKAKAIADSRMTQVVPLARRLHRELEWIPLKAMRKDRCRRYKSTSDMADDIQSYLNGNPLVAGPETSMYRVQKFVHKHAGSVAMVALVAVAIVLGLVTSILLGCRAERARKQETAARKQVEQALARVEKAEKVAQEQRKLAEQQADKYRNLSYTHGVALADLKYRERNLRDARELLKSCPEDLRNWEWYRLNYVTDEALMILGPPRTGFSSIAVSPEGKRIAAASMRSEDISIWDAESGNVILTFKGHKNKIAVGLVFSPDGQRLVSAGFDNTIKVWDVSNGSEIMSLAGHSESIKSVALSSDGKLIASSGFDKTVRIWDASTGQEIRTLLGHNDFVTSVAFSPDGRHIASGSYDHTVRVWDAARGEELRSFNVQGRKIITVSFDPAGRRIAMGCGDGTIKVLNVETGEEVMLIEGRGWDQSLITQIVFSQDGKRLVSGSYDQTVRIWDAETGQELKKLLGHDGPVYSVAVNPDGTHIASGGVHDVKVWDASTGEELMALHGHKVKGAIHSVAFSPDGKSIVSTGSNKTIRIWDAETGKELRILSGHMWLVCNALFTPDSERIVSGAYDGTVRIWDSATGSQLMTLLGHKENHIESLALSPDGKRIVSGSFASTKLWDIDSGAELMTISDEHGAMGLAFSPNGKTIAGGCGPRKGDITLWQSGPRLAMDGSDQSSESKQQAVD